MIPSTNQQVKCFMRNATVLEGTVEEWSDNNIVLRTLDGKSLLIVHNPFQDIMITKIILEETKDNIIEEKLPLAVNKTDLQQRVKDKLYEVQNADPDFNQMNIQELKQLVVEQEKQLIENKKKEHFGSVASPKNLIKYSSQNLIFKKSKNE